jgi:DNA-binding NarL/FixJ family response regulator
VILADRSLSVRAVLRRLLEQAPEIEVVGDSDDGREVVRLAAEKRPAAIILDLDLPSLSG